MENDPLGQRSSGRRQRRAAREAAVPSHEPRGPSDAIERRIAESIEKRTKSNAAAAVNTALHVNDEDTDILGTYEYLDHTADIQLHSWGESFPQALEALVMAMFGYQTKLSLVDVNEDESAQYGSNVRVESHDIESLVFAFLQEWLCIFHESGFVPREVTVQSADLTHFTTISSGRGEKMKPEKHLQGTEVKAVTYSNLQVIQDDTGNRFDIWVILDI